MKNIICCLVWLDMEERTLEEKVENECLQKNIEQITNETAEIHTGKGVYIAFLNSLSV